MTIDDDLAGNSLRLPPANLQAEQSLLGALLANAKAFDRVAEFLQPHHFADPIHGRIFESIARRLNSGLTADPVVLRAEFQNAGTLDDVGGTAYLAQLLGAMVGIINAGDYGRVILDAWIRRELIDLCVEIVNRCYAPGDMSGAEIIESLDESLGRINEGAGDIKPSIPAGEAVGQALRLSEAAAKRESALAGITTGFASVDRMTGGLMPGQTYLLGARPAMGKTGLGLVIAARVAGTVNPATGKPHRVLHWSGEMAANQLGTRLAASYADLEVASVFRGKGWKAAEIPGHRPSSRPLDLEEWEKLVLAERAAQELLLDFDDRAGLTVAALRSRARKLKRAKGLDLIVVDYVGLMRATQQTERQKLYERMTEISRDLQMMAAELHVPLLVMAQLNRANESRENKMPQLSDLRDSGALEQDAYCVMFIHRPHYYLTQAGEPAQGAKESAEVFHDRCDVYHQQLESTRNLALISVAKNRNGPTGICRLRFNAETIWFRDESEAENSAAWGSNFTGGL